MRLIALVLAFVTGVCSAQVVAPSGRFMQNVSDGYRDIKISEDGRTAVWITKDCVSCPVVTSRPEMVVVLADGRIRIGDAIFERIEASDWNAAKKRPTWGSSNEFYKASVMTGSTDYVR